MLTAAALNLEGLRAPVKPLPLILFNSKNDILECERMSDKCIVEDS